MKAIYCIGLLALFIVSFIGLKMHYVFMHEHIHQEIYEQYGVSNINITFGDFGLSGRTTAFIDCDINNCEKISELNSMNEIVGYNTDVIISAILIGSFLISLAVVFSYDREPERSYNSC